MILVTGVSGALGGLVRDGLSAAGGLEVVAGTSSATRTTARRVDFDDPATLGGGFAGVDVLVFISAGYAEDDVILADHGAVVAAGVRHVIYTSLASSGDLMTLALSHRWTEARLAAAPFDVTVLRNGCDRRARHRRGTEQVAGPYGRIPPRLPGGDPQGAGRQWPGALPNRA